jgi:hypothetical protein
MRKAFTALVVGGSIAATALPALAQSHQQSTAQRESAIGDRITAGVEGVELRPDDASRLRAELRQIVDLNQRYQEEGMTDRQIRDLNSRLSRLSSNLEYDLSIDTGPMVECEGYCFTP